MSEPRIVGDALRLDGVLRCGMVMAGGDGDAVRGLARRMESAGLDSIWVGDHVAFHVPILESLTLLAFTAALTERVTLGTSVYLMPLRHPTLTAKVTSTLDHLAGGRLVLGVGVGGEYPPEFEAVGVPVRERGARTDEGLPLLRRLWSESRVAHAGRHFGFGEVSIDPKPVRAAGPPIWVGGRKAPAFRRAGRLGDGYISHMASPAMYAEHLDTIAAHARDAGRAPRDFATAAFLFTVLDDDHEHALDRAGQMLGVVYNRPFRDAARKYCLLGRPEDCVEQMARFVEAGCRHFILSPLSDPTEFLERVAEEILPALRRLAP